MKMHQTTLRFAPELWESLEHEAAAAGVSVAQYVREAALARVVYTLGRRGDEAFDKALEAASGRSSKQAETVLAAERQKELSTDTIDSSSALWAQARQARARARELSSSSERARRRHTRALG
jgi:hypothetical protein